MNYTTYLLLIGAASAQYCTSDAITTTNATMVTAAQAYATVAATRTADVNTYEGALGPLKAHLAEMDAALLVAKKNNIAEELATAEINATAAQTALNNFLAAGTNSTHNAVLVNITKALDAQAVAQEAYQTAINSCVPPIIKAWQAENKAALVLKMKYAEMTAEEKVAFDAKVKAREEKGIAAEALIKAQAGYHDMDDANKAMYDKIMLAQLQLKAEEVKNFAGKMDDEKLKENYAKMTDAEKKAFKAQFGERMDKFENRKDSQFMGDFEMKNMCGEQSKMNGDKKAMFEQKLGEQKQGRDADEKKWDGKITEMRGKAEYSTMDATKRMGKMSDMMDDKKQDLDRKDQYRMQDMAQMCKNGYFNMSDKERGNYDKKMKEFGKGRKDDDDKWDGMRDSFKQMGGFDGMDKSEKQKLMSGFDKMRNMNTQQNFRDRQGDDDERKKMGYFNQSDSKRGDMDKQMQFSGQQRDQSRQMIEDGGIGQSCEIITKKDMMIAKMNDKKDERDDKDDKEGHEGKEGPGGKKRMLQAGPPKGGVVEKAQKAGVETPFKTMMMGADKSGMPPMMGEKQGQMGRGQQGGQQGGKGGQQSGKGGNMQMMGKMQEMMQGFGGKSMGQDGMMKGSMGQNMGGMGGKAGTDMMGKMIEKMKGGKGKSGMMQNGGCGEGLCCGHRLVSGVWEENNSICNKDRAITFMDYTFKCQLSATNLIASTVGILTAAFVLS